MHNKKLKVLLINRWVGYNYGGNESIMHDVIKHFSELGHEITVVTTRGEALETYKNIRKEYINAPQGYYSYGPFGFIHALMFLVKAFFRVTKLILQGNKFDIQSIHFSLEALLARFIKFLYGIPYVHVVAGDTFLEMIEAKRADGVVHICAFMNNQGKKFNHSSVVIPVGIDMQRFNPNKYSEDLRKKYLHSDGEKLCVSVCRLDPRKSLITIIEAMDLIVNKKGIKNIKHVIVGGGVEEEYLKKKIKEYKLEKCVFMAGRVSEEELPIYHASADLFVLPTLYETFGIVYTEAMASGTPVLTTNGEAASEVVGNMGILVETKNPRLLSEMMVEVLFDEERLKKMSEKALDYVKKYSIEVVSKQYEDYYYKVSNQSVNFISRLKSFLFIFPDSVKIIKNLFSNVLFNKPTTEESSWDGSGHASLN